jgi:predicted esterase
VAALQSSQALWKGAYVWDDRDITERDVKHAYATLSENYAVDDRRLILAGHSLGGEMAMWLALKGAIPAAAFLAIGPGGPWMDNLEAWQPLLRERVDSDLRGYIITGEQDTSIPHENIETLVQWLNRAGVQCELETVSGLEHDHTPEYDPAVQRGLNFLME